MNSFKTKMKMVNAIKCCGFRIKPALKTNERKDLAKEANSINE